MITRLTPDEITAVKQKQQAIWDAGDYAVIGTSLQLIGERLCEAVDLSAGTRVLDVAAGNGNAALASARRGCEVTACDYVPSLLDRAQRRAEAEACDWSRTSPTRRRSHTGMPASTSRCRPWA